MADEKSPFSSTVNYGAAKQPRQALTLADLGSKPNGQTFEERKRKGVSEIAVWVPDEMKANLPKLAQAMGVKSVKEALQRALQDALDRYL